MRLAIAVLLATTQAVALGSHPACRRDLRLYLLSDMRTTKGSHVSRFGVTNSERPARLPSLGLLLHLVWSVNRPDLSESTPTIEDRKGWQIVASVRAYLQWRAGDTWRPASHRFHPEKVPYTQAINFLNGAQASAAVCDCPYCHGAPFVGERKPADRENQPQPAPQQLASRRLRSALLFANAKRFA